MKLSTREIIILGVVLTVGIFFLSTYCSTNSCLFFPLPYAITNWILLCSVIASGLHLSRVKENKIRHQRFLGLLMLGLGMVGNTLGWAFFQASYDFFGTGYRYYFLPAMAAIIYGGVSYYYFQKHLNTKSD